MFAQKKKRSSKDPSWGGGRGATSFFPPRDKQNHRSLGGERGKPRKNKPPRFVSPAQAQYGFCFEKKKHEEKSLDTPLFSPLGTSKQQKNRKRSEDSEVPDLHQPVPLGPGHHGAVRGVRPGRLAPALPQAAAVLGGLAEAGGGSQRLGEEIWKKERLPNTGG